MEKLYPVQYCTVCISMYCILQLHILRFWNFLFNTFLGSFMFNKSALIEIAPRSQISNMAWLLKTVMSLFIMCIYRISKVNPNVKSFLVSNKPSKGSANSAMLVPWKPIHGPVSLKIFPSWFKFDMNIILSSKLEWSYGYWISHMPQQHSCYGMCNNL